MNVAMVTSTVRACGIADYARDLVAALEGRVAIDIVPVEERPEIPEHADVVHLQYEHGFFLDNDDPAGNLDRFLTSVARPTLITLHCLPLDDPRWLRWLGEAHIGFHVHSGEHSAALLAMDSAARVWESPFPIPARVEPGTSAGEIAARFGLAGRRVLAMYGFIKKHKGFDVALEALQHMPADVVLLVAGGAQDADDEATAARLVETAERLGLADRLVITGYLAASEVGPVLETADLVLAPFHTVTGSASVAAALAWERPVLGSDLPQLRELRDRFGCICCVPGNDPQALAAEAMRLLDDAGQRDALSAGARAARGAATFDAIATRCLEAYEALGRTAESRR
jgi:glycosyltransferase involved in cell wall biosynthesis